MSALQESSADPHTVSVSFEEEFADERRAVTRALEVCADELLRDDGARLAEAIRYAMLGPGKRIRGVLLLASYRSASGRADAGALAAAVEIVHAYSLVHDDLPCMDDDDVRRGRATVHRKWSVRTATVAGVAMVPLAVRAALRGCTRAGLDRDTSANVVTQLMRAAGAGGMIGGQLLDLQSHGDDFGLSDLERIHRGKTGALIAASASIGGLAAGATERQLAALSRYGHAIGLAFQIADDVLDVTSTSDRLGKTAGRDAALGKRTYPALLGVPAAIERASGLVDDACEVLEASGLDALRLQRLAKFVILRES